MIVQVLLDFWAEFLAALVGTIPALPAQFSASTAAFVDAAATVSTYAARLSPLIPWTVISGCLATWVGLLTYWTATVAVRGFMWVIGR